MKKCYFLMLIVSFGISSFAQTSVSTQGHLSTQSIKVNAGWNLMSLPLSVIDSTKNSLFPTAVSSAFIYQNSYLPKDTLNNGYGFWLKFDSAETLPIVGDIIYDNTIEVRTGWNIIGSLTVPIAVSTIRTDTPDIIVSELFGYSNGIYQSTDTLQPGFGYWVKVNEPGSIILSYDDHPPTIPSDPSPADSAVGQPLNDTLIWSACSDPDGDPLTYDVYFGIENPPTEKISIDQTNTSLVRNGLTNGTQYFWKVIAKDNHGNTTEGLVWRFTTMGAPCPETPTVDYAGKIYNTVQIGNQCWLKENLDIGTMVNGVTNQTNNDTIEKYCYNNEPAKCDTFGGLYKWNEAMQYSTIPGVQGICPSGWHISTYEEFHTLGMAVGFDGNALKAIGQGTGTGAGTNTSGFSALLAGCRYTNYGFFYYLGNYTYFWLSIEGSTYYAGAMYLYYNDSNIISYGFDKEYGFSVRCVKDLGEAPQVPELSSPSNGSIDIPTPPPLIWKRSNGAASYTLQVSTDSLFSSFAYNVSGLTDTSQQISELINSTKYYWHVSATNSYSTSNWSSRWSFTTSTPCPGIPTVTYAGRTYNTVQIGSQCWLKENLDVGTMIQGSQNQTNNDTIEKYCYNNDTANCNTYGGLYQWDEAMQYSTIEGTRGICPSGWHIPTYAEFHTLSATVGYDGNALKAIGEGIGDGAGTNTSGFSALLSGFRDSYGDFTILGYFTDFWSSTENSTGSAYYMNLYFNDSSIYYAVNAYKEAGFSVRCVKD